MVGFVNKLEFNGWKYQTNGTILDESYKKKLLFPIKDLVSFGTDCQSLFFMSTIF